MNPVAKGHLHRALRGEALQLDAALADIHNLDDRRPRIGMHFSRAGDKLRYWLSLPSMKIE